jgi:uncharacterized protein
MIEVNVVRFDGKVASISMDGHAEAGAYGHDLVCAGASACLEGTIYSLEDEFKTISYKVAQEDGHALIEVHGQINQHDSIALEVLIKQLEFLSRDKKGKYIRVKDELKKGK